jgi:hypothetical protein
MWWAKADAHTICLRVRAASASDALGPAGRPPATSPPRLHELAVGALRGRARSPSWSRSGKCGDCEEELDSADETQPEARALGPRDLGARAAPRCSAGRRGTAHRVARRRRRRQQRAEVRPAGGRARSHPPATSKKAPLGALDPLASTETSRTSTADRRARAAAARNPCGPKSTAAVEIQPHPSNVRDAHRGNGVKMPRTN